MKEPNMIYNPKMVNKPGYGDSCIMQWKNNEKE
jgi:hypothetical protein